MNTSPATSRPAEGRPANNSEFSMSEFYAERGQGGLVDGLSHCLGYHVGSKFYYNPYEAKSLIEHAPRWDQIVPELQLSCLLGVYAIAGRTLTPDLYRLNIPADPQAALSLLKHIHERGWTSDSCRVPHCCVASYRGDFESCAARMITLAYPEFFEGSSDSRSAALCAVDSALSLARDLSLLDSLLSKTFKQLALERVGEVMRSASDAEAAATEPSTQGTAASSAAVASLDLTPAVIPNAELSALVASATKIS